MKKMNWFFTLLVLVGLNAASPALATPVDVQWVPVSPTKELYAE